MARLGHDKARLLGRRKSIKTDIIRYHGDGMGVKGQNGAHHDFQLSFSLPK